MEIDTEHIPATAKRGANAGGPPGNRSVGHNAETVDIRPSFIVNLRPEARKLAPGDETNVKPIEKLGNRLIRRRIGHAH